MNKKVALASDNGSSAHPLIMRAVMEANEGEALSYGADRWTLEAQQLIRETFKRDCKVLIVPTGTGANVLALTLCCERHESVICTDISHINYQESGAAEAIVGCKLVTVPHRQGKVTPKELLKRLQRERAFGCHSTSPRLLSITQPTEVGTIYSLEELDALAFCCKEEGLLLHIDGSRLYNAAVSLKRGLDELLGSLGVSILSLGGTKNGLMGAEALLLFDPMLAPGADYLQKQTLQLMSKMRYLSAQYIPFFKEELWRTLAKQANQKAQEIASILEAIPSVSWSYPVETNQLFFVPPPAWIPFLQERISCHLWDREKGELRFIASWNTSEEDVSAVYSIFSQLANG